MIIYRSFYEAIIELPAENQAILWRAVFELGLNGNQIELKGLNSTIFKLIKPQIEANIKRYENGKKPKGSKPEANEKQKISKSETNNNKNNNNNKNKNTIEFRKSEFYKKVAENLNQYPKEMLREFFEYWAEHGESDHKMRFEKEKSFGLSRRLSTWFRNSGDKYSKNEKDPLVLHVKNQLNDKARK